MLVSQGCRVCTQLVNWFYSFYLLSSSKSQGGQLEIQTWCATRHRVFQPPFPNVLASLRPNEYPNTRNSLIVKIIKRIYFVRWTHPSTQIRSLFVLINVCRVFVGFPLVIASARLLWLLIQRISKSLRCSYDCRIAIISIISLFSFVVPSLTVYLYKENKSVLCLEGSC